MRYSSVTILLVLFFALSSCVNSKKEEQIISTEIPFKKEGELLLVKATGDTIQKLDIEIADDDYQRETGLMHRSSMATTRGMLFIFEDEVQRGFYMKNTLIPLDLIYIGSDNTIVSFAENAKPMDENTLPSRVPAQYVLEINGGLSEEWGLDIGDRVVWSRN